MALHASVPTFGGRYTTQIPERQKHWRDHLSKKATKREKRREERTSRRRAASAGNDRSSSALVAAEARMALPPPEVLEARSQDNRLAIESIVLPQSSFQKTSAAEAQVDVAALHAALLAGRVDRRSERHWALLIRSAGAQGKMDTALAAFQDMQAAGVTPSVYSYTSLLQACGGARNSAAAEAVWSSMTAAGVAPTEVAVGARMQAHIRAGNLGAAFDALKEASSSGMALSAVAFTHLLAGCVAVGELERAWEVYWHMRSYHDIIPDTPAYTTMITACARRDEVEKALGLWSEMKQHGLVLTAVAYNALIHAAGRSMRLHAHAHDLYHEMGVAGLPRDSYTYNAVLLACSQVGDVARAREYVAAMHREGLRPDARTLSTLVAVYARALHALKKRPDPRRDASAEEVAAAAAGDGSALIALDRSGELSDPKRAGAAHVQTRKRLVGDGAREIRGSLEDVTERLLADYFGVDAGAESDEELLKGGLDDEGKGGSGTAAAAAAAAKHLRPVQAYRVDLADPSYQATKARLLELGLLDEESVAEFEREQGRLPAVTAGEASRRAVQGTQAGAQRMQQLKEEAVALAKQSLAARGATASSTSSAAAGSSSGGTAAASALLSTTAAGVFSDVMAHANLMAAKSAGSGGSGRGDGDSDRERGRSSAEIALAAEASGGDLPVGEYMRALEQEVMTAFHGPEWATVTKTDPTTGAQRTVRVRRWISMFNPDATLGGIAVRDLLDVRTIPLPRRKGHAGATTGREDEELDVDVQELYAHYVTTLKQRVQDALAREIAANPSLAGAAAAKEARYSDPYLSDDADEYRAIAAAYNKQQKQHQQHPNSATASAVQAEAAADGGDSGGDSGSATLAADTDGSALTATAAAANSGVEAPRPGMIRRKRNAPIAPAAEAVAAAAAAADAEAEVVLPLSPEAAEALQQHEAAVVTAAADAERKLTKAQRARRAFTARVMQRLLAAHPLGPVELALVRATETASKRRQRAAEGSQPALLDALLAVQDMKKLVMKENLDAAAAAASTTAATTAEAASAKDAREAVAAAVAARHIARQAAARQELITAVSSPDGVAASRLQAVVEMSDRVLAGAHWLSDRAAYPQDKHARRAVLLAEIKRIYTTEVGTGTGGASGVTPDTPLLNSFLTALCEAGGAEGAADAYSFLATEYTRHGCSPDARTFRPLIRMHVQAGDRPKAERALAHMQDVLHLSPDAECYGWVIHARARDWALKDAIQLIKTMKARGMKCNEQFAHLLRQRCKEAGLSHPDVPAHPLGWQFTPEVMSKRRARSTSIRKQVTHGLPMKAKMY